MAVEQIDVVLCNGCGKCIKSCPTDVLKMDKVNKKAVIKYPQECVICCWCIAECPQDAIYLSPVKMAPLFTSWG